MKFMILSNNFWGTRIR